MCLSKALTNGQLPLAVTMLTDEIYRAFYADFQDGKTFYHGHTFTANTFGCVVANATLTALDEWDWKRNVDAIHQRLGVQLNQLNDQFYCLSNPRAIGTVGAIDIDLPGDRAMFELTQIGFEHHLTIRPLGNTLYLYLPLVTTQDELNDIFNQLSTVITKAING
jgi:adenosylmethionine-8-amino-7-oxononanoate aminotransferase